jgi:hypothetical protein
MESVSVVVDVFPGFLQQKGTRGVLETEVDGMTKTPDETKEAMLHCSPVSCRSTGCPYKADTPKYEGDMPVCRMKLWHDMRHLIQQLEAERDAAVEEVHGNCHSCKYYIKDPKEEPCASCLSGFGNKDNWQWRGVQKEE